MFVGPNGEELAHVEVYEDGERVITHKWTNGDYSIEMVRKDHPEAAVTVGCLCGRGGGPLSSAPLVRR